MMFIIVTQDQFFFMGMKQSFPDSVQVGNWNNQLAKTPLYGRHLTLIIDNRIPLHHMYNLLEWLLLTHKKISAVIFEVSKGVLYQRLTRSFGGYVSTESIKDHRQLHDMVRGNIHNLRTFPFLRICSLHEHEKAMIQTGICHSDISKQSEVLGYSKKTLYTRRNLMQRRMGFSSFIQVCNFVFRNELL